MVEDRHARRQYRPSADRTHPDGPSLGWSLCQTAQTVTPSSLTGQMQSMGMVYDLSGCIVPCPHVCSNMHPPQCVCTYSCRACWRREEAHSSGGMETTDLRIRPISITQAKLSSLRTLWIERTQAGSAECAETERAAASTRPTPHHSSKAHSGGSSAAASAPPGIPPIHANASPR